MEFLKNYFSEDEVNALIQDIPDVFKNTLDKENVLVSHNLDYLKELGCTNLYLIFKNYYDMFLMDNSEFINVFNKYDKEDLIDKLNKNVAIVEYL
jgi:hypothetical protein